MLHRHRIKHFLYNINSRIWQLLSFFKNFNEVKAAKKKVKAVFLSHGITNDSNINDEKSLLLHYSNTRPREAVVLAEEFFKEDVRLIKKSYEDIPRNEPILLCNVKDDIRRIKLLLEHHRKLGIKFYAILDNCSTDGTREWLLSQDIDLYSTTAEYNSVRRAMWIQKIAEKYGYNRWYIILDSDELLVYEGMENKTIHHVISALERLHIDAGLGMMIDMYSDLCNLYDQDENEDIFRKYCYFDSDTYEVYRGKSQVYIFGGFRQRYFEDSNGKELMTKHPLYYWRRNRIYRYHFSFPYKYNYYSPLLFGLLHYKFLDGDYEKYKKIAANGNYAGGSILYKKYLNKLGNERKISFMYEGTVKFESSKSINKINIWGRY